MSVNMKFGLGLKNVRPAWCTASEVITDFVYVAGNPVSGKDQVRKADPSDFSKMPSVGVVINKSGDTQCQVQWMGETPDIFSGLTAGDIYFLGSDAKIAPNPPTSPTGMFNQVVAVALSDTKAFINPENNLVKTYRP